MEISIDVSSLERAARRFEEGPQILAEEMNRAMNMSLDVIEQVVAEETPVGVTESARGSIAKEIFGVPLTDDYYGIVEMTVLYSYYLENGRAKGKMPPPQALELWVSRKWGLSGKEARDAAWGLAYYIGHGSKKGPGGTKGAHMFARGWATTKPIVEGIWQKLPERFNARMRGS
jgi:hypothetical protein